MLGAELVKADKRWVGLQLVAPEDGIIATRDYRLHMQMVDRLTDHGRSVPAALHAGELTLKYATPEELSHRVADAVRIAGARRIGHGTDIAHEEAPRPWSRKWRKRHRGGGEPVVQRRDPRGRPEGPSVSWLRARGVPTALSTDDEAILRIDLSREYEVAAKAGATYDDLKRSARNAIAFSFLSGEGCGSTPAPTRGCAQPAPLRSRRPARTSRAPSSCAAATRRASNGGTRRR
jgi:adenosine deaminase